MFERQLGTKEKENWVQFHEFFREDCREIRKRKSHEIQLLRAVRLK